MTDLRDDSALEQNDEEREAFSLDEYKLARFKTPTLRDSAENSGRDSIENVLAEETGVLSVDTDYAAKIITVKYETDMSNPQTLSEVIREAGFENEILPEGEDDSDLSEPDLDNQSGEDPTRE